MSEPEILLIGIPYDANSSFLRGPEKAPKAIRHQLTSPHSNTFSELGINVEKGECWLDLGDMAIQNLPSVEADAVIEQEMQSALASNKRVVALGGDHSVTFPILRALSKFHTNINILHIDAHPDLYDSLDDNPLSHACPFARIMEKGLATRLVQVGIRTMNTHQRSQADRFGVEVHEMKDWHSEFTPAFDGPVYLSIDIDGMDPAFAPGVSHHEPGGLSVRDVINLIHRFKGKLIGADVVELNPGRDINDVTAVVAAKLVREIMGRMVLDSRP